MNKTFFIADTHFAHANIIRLCNRPFSSAIEMDDFMIKKWNNVVGEYDRVIHGGDFALGMKGIQQKIFDQLNGFKYLVKGNHDRSKAKMLELGFIDVFKYWYEDGVLFVHKPQDLLEKYKDMYAECRIALYGHVHNNPFPPIPKTINACVEMHSYEPFLVKI